MRVRLIGTDLPGKDFPDSNYSGNCYEDIFVGIQRGKENEQLTSGTANEAIFEFEMTPKAELDATGPYVHGRKSERFIYLSWVAGPKREMFRRAKIFLSSIPLPVWTEADREGSVLEGRLGLTDSRGGPLCARVPTGAIRWISVNQREEVHGWQ